VGEFLLVPAYPGSPGPTAVKQLCVCVCVLVDFGLLSVRVRCAGRYKYIIKEESANVYYIGLELSTPEAIDAATYKLNARNQHGESNANLKLNFDGNHCCSYSCTCTYLYLSDDGLIKPSF